MGRRTRRKSKEPPELNITTFLNLMVVLVPFLLITAVFSRITILELNLPAGAANQPDKPKLSIEVTVRAKGIEIGNGRSVVARIPKNGEGEYDLKQLSVFLLKIKNGNPDKTDATILMEPDIEYNFLVGVMDAVRVAEIAQGEEAEVQKIALFPDISIGDAP
jgi:biopolymer transport protein ExbD